MTKSEVIGHIYRSKPIECTREEYYDHIGELLVEVAREWLCEDGTGDVMFATNALIERRRLYTKLEMEALDGKKN